MWIFNLPKERKKEDDIKDEIKDNSSMDWWLGQGA
jgi:hypothetical protein